MEKLLHFFPILPIMCWNLFIEPTKIFQSLKDVGNYRVEIVHFEYILAGDI